MYMYRREFSFGLSPALHHSWVFLSLHRFPSPSSYSNHTLSLSLSLSGDQEMMDQPALCCMCGDVGFPEKLFRCSQCCNRYQHSYCSNYSSESSEPIEQCDWCQSELRSSSRHRGSSSQKLAAGNDSSVTKSEYSGGGKIKQQQQRDDAPGPAPAEKGAARNPGGAPSPRTATRRYKLLKDVMC
ncbi:hypothetical protein BT93_D1319 [Corymbia citriodora subsp. variegata]|nr:hypothetical protein BT93_D1319 [Corymbia citriodora subsp. variegata]